MYTLFFVIYMCTCIYIMDVYIISYSNLDIPVDLDVNLLQSFLVCLMHSFTGLV